MDAAIGHWEEAASRALEEENLVKAQEERELCAAANMNLGMDSSSWCFLLFEGSIE
jgi:hypothetical protein